MSSTLESVGRSTEVDLAGQLSARRAVEGEAGGRPKDDPEKKAVWIGACLFDGGKNAPTLQGEDKKGGNGGDKPNGKLDEFTGFRHLNVEEPPAGKNDWHYELNVATRKLKITKTEGHWKDGKYTIDKEVGSDEIDAPSKFEDFKFKGEQITRADAPNSDMATLFTLRGETVTPERWDYMLRVAELGGTGTRTDPFIGFETPLRAGDVLTIGGAGIRDPFVTGPAEQRELGGWIVHSFDDHFVAFQATSDALLLPATEISGFGFFSEGVPGQAPWNLASDDSGSTGVVPGPVAVPTIAFFQLDVSLDRVNTPDSGWGAAQLTHEGFLGLLYFNLAVNGSWQVRNVPVLSVEGYGVVQTAVFNFNLGVPHGTDVTEINFAFDLGPASLKAMPAGSQRAPVADRAYRINSGIDKRTMKMARPAWLIGLAQDAKPVLHEGFPNQESKRDECVPTAVSNSLQWLKKRFALEIEDAEITIDKMKVATGWHPATASKKAGADQGWPKLKDEYMKKNKLPVKTTKLNANDFASLYKALEKGCDVELSTATHTVAVIGMSGCDPTKAATSKTRCTLVVAHDTDQTNPSSGTMSEVVVYSPTSAKLQGGGPWTQDKVKHFIVECPEVGG